MNLRRYSKENRILRANRNHFPFYFLSGLKKFPEWEAFPDSFVFPEAIPTRDNPKPKLPDIKDDIFLSSLYGSIAGYHNLNDPKVLRHIWKCNIDVFQTDGIWKRRLHVINALYPEINFLKSGTSITNVKVIYS